MTNPLDTLRALAGICPKCNRPAQYEGDGWDCLRCGLEWTSEAYGYLAIEHAQNPFTLLQALHATKVIEGFGITANGEWTVEITYKDEDGDDCTPMGAAGSPELALSVALRNCPATVQELCFPALARWTAERRG